MNNYAKIPKSYAKNFLFFFQKPIDKSLNLWYNYYRKKEKERNQMRITAIYFRMSMRWFVREGERTIAQGYGLASLGSAIHRAEEKYGVKVSTRWG